MKRLNEFFSHEGFEDMQVLYYWYVFDYSAPAIFVFRDYNPVDSNEEKILRKHGFKANECNWLISEEPLEIEETR